MKHSIFFACSIIIATMETLLTTYYCYRSSTETLAGDLIANGGNRVVSLEVRRRVKLTGAELEEHRLKVSL